MSFRSFFRSFSLLLFLAFANRVDKALLAL